MSERCYKCFKPISNCLCKYTKELNVGVKFVFLMHPKEAKRQRTGTGNIARISLKDSEIIVGFDFNRNERLRELLDSEKYFSVLMYPGKDAWTVKNQDFKNALGNKTLLVIILDATWFCAKKTIEKNPFLLKLPKISFYGDYRSIFTFKHEPKPECVSTVESCYYFIKEMQSEDFIDKKIDPTPMMNAFKQMILFQIQAENERILGIRPNSHNYDAKYKKIKPLPTFDR